MPAQDFRLLRSKHFQPLLMTTRPKKVRSRRPKAAKLMIKPASFNGRCRRAHATSRKMLTIMISTTSATKTVVTIIQAFNASPSGSVEDG
jgi:hypothetical protein